jgi:adenosylcobinamide-GDP ribazoletransferase
LKYIQAFFMSLGMFSSIPCPYRPWNEKARHLMLVFLPVVGLVIGLLWYGIALLLSWLGIPIQLAAAVLMLYPYLVTGFIHLDGFMDTTDALLSRRPLEEKLRILKDPHTGAFAVISVGVLFILCYASMSSVVEQVHFKNALDIAGGDVMPALILIPVMTRCCSAVAVLAGKPLAHSQYKTDADAKKPVAEVTTICVMGLAAVLAALAAGSGFFGGETAWAIPMVLFCAVIAYFSAIFGAFRQLGGVSGDLAGYSLTIAEAFAVIALAVLV